MATAREVIKSALRKILADSEEPASDDMADALDTFNDFMESLALEGVFVAHQTLNLEDTVNIDKSHIQTLKHHLAVLLAPDYSAAIDPQVAFTAREGMKALRADTKLRRATRIDTALLRSKQW